MVLDRIELNRIEYIKGEITPPPDKSISHRAVILSAISKGKSSIRNFLKAEDTLSTVSAFRSLGIKIEESGDELIIYGKGIHGLKEPEEVINCNNSGTTVRLLSGILSGNPFFSVLSGDSSLRKRPMQRVIIPLKEMGAEIMGRDNDRYLPVSIRGRRLKPISYKMPVASAQVKSAILLAGLYAEGETEVIEPLPSRDHTERMLPSFGADVFIDASAVRVKGAAELHASDTIVPADFSSAAFFIVAAMLFSKADIVARNVCINLTRTGLLNILKRMGADVRLENIREISGEPVADVCVKGGNELKAVKIKKDEIPFMLDEFPILCIAATQAEGVTTISGAGELRVKESDRIKAMATELRKLGAEVKEYPDGLAIKGKSGLKGCEVESYGDHRIAMSLAIAGLIAKGITCINNASCVDISFPGFFEEIKRLANG